MSVTLKQTLNDFADMGIFTKALTEMGLGLVANNGKCLKNYYQKDTTFIPDFIVNGSNNLLGVKLQEDGTIRIEGDSHYLGNKWNQEKLKQVYSKCAIEDIMEQNGYNQVNYETDTEGNIHLQYAS